MYLAQVLKKIIHSKFDQLLIHNSQVNIISGKEWKMIKLSSPNEDEQEDEKIGKLKTKTKLVYNL